MSGRRSNAVAVSAVALAIGAVVVSETARGEHVEARRGKTILVGKPPGPSPTDRVDAARTGASRALLPTGALHVAWRRSLGLPVEAPPLVDGRGDVTIVTARGDLVVLAPDGEERSHTVVGSAAAGAATLLSDDTAAFLTTAGDVVGVRLGALRFRTHVGGGRSSVSPLTLGDGGVVVATQAELVALDGEGGVRARAALDPDDAPVQALAAVEDPPQVFAVTASGAVVAWVPGGGRDAARVGSFRGAVDGGVAIARGRILAVTGGELVALDPSNGALTTLATATTSGALAFLGPPSVLEHDATVSLLALTPSRTLALSFAFAFAFALAPATGAPDASDVATPPSEERLHQSIAPTMLQGLADGGVNVASAPPHLGTLVDPRGDVAFALPSGELGVVSPSGTVDVVGEVCARSNAPSALASLGIRGGPTYAGLAPAGPFAVVVACGTGVVARIDSDFAPSP